MSRIKIIHYLRVKLLGDSNASVRSHYSIKHVQSVGIYEVTSGSRCLDPVLHGFLLFFFL